MHKTTALAGIHFLLKVYVLLLWLICHYSGNVFYICYFSMTSFIELIGVLRGLEKVGRAAICLRQRELQSMWKNSSLQPIVHKCSVGLEEVASDCIVAEKPTPCVSVALQNILHS